MKRLFVFLFVSIVACTALYARPWWANPCSEEGTFYVEDDFGDPTNNFYRGLGHYDGTYKLSSGKTGNAGMHFMLNNFNKDVIITIQDQGETENFYGNIYTEWYDYDCYLSLDWTSPSVTVKIKFQDGKVKEYKGTLENDDITGSGAVKMVRIKDLQDDIVGQESMMISVSNSSVSYTFRDVSLYQSWLVFIKMHGDWKITASTDPSIKSGELHFWPKRGSTVQFDDYFNDKPSWGTKTIDDKPVFYFSPGDSENGPFYNVTFSSDGKKVVLKNTSTEKEITLQRI